MILKKITSSLLVITMLTQSILPILAMETTDFNIDIQKSPGNNTQSHPQLSLEKPPLNTPTQQVDINTGASILHYALFNDQIQVLLGKRNDKENAWCNFGGKSDVTDLTFAHVASRESKEESNGTYTIHPRLLKNQPFIDLLTKKEKGLELHRMYWQEVRYLPRDILVKKLEEAKEGHCKEYTNFMWLPISDLCRSILIQDPIIPDTNICLYGPLYSMLSTKSGQLFLMQLANLKTLNLVKGLRNFKNCLYTLNEVGNDPIDFTYAPSVLNQDDILSESVAFHASVMLQFKSLLYGNEPIKPIETQLWNPNCGETLSRIHLRVALGAEFKEPQDFSEEPNPQRAADLANIKTYFSVYNESAYDQKYNEFKREIKPEESDYNYFADILAWESKHHAWPTFVHGASSNSNNFFKSITFIRELMGIDFFEDRLAMRATDIQFKDYKTIWDMIDKTGAHETHETQNAMLFLNFVLFAGLKTTRSTSSSAEYVLNDHSVNEQNISQRFEEAMALAGFSKPDYAYFQSIFEQFVKYQHSTLANSVMIAISHNPEHLDDFNYPTGGGGRYYQTKEGQEIQSSCLMLNKIQNEYERLIDIKMKTGEREPFSIDSDRKRDLFCENRLFLHPNHMMNPDHIRMKSFDRFALNKQDRADYKAEMQLTTAAILADWLSQHTTLIPGSFVNEPLLKKLYKMVYKGCMFVETGLEDQELQEKACTEGFVHLIENGQIENITGYIDSYPEIIKGNLIAPEMLIKAALKSLNLETASLFLNFFPNRDIKDLFLDDKGKLLFCDSVVLKNYDMANLLLKLGADVNAALYGTTILHYTLEKFTDSGLEKLQFLLKNGADVTVKNGKDLTPLEVFSRARFRKNCNCKKHEYVPEGTSSAIKLLLEHGSDSNILHEWDDHLVKKWLCEIISKTATDEEFLYLFQFLKKGDCRRISCFQRCLPFLEKDAEFQQKYKNYFDVSAFFNLARKPDITLPTSEIFDMIVDMDNLLGSDFKYLSGLLQVAELPQLQKLFDAYPKFADRLVATVLKEEIHRHLLHEILQDSPTTAVLCCHPVFKLVLYTCDNLNRLFGNLAIGKHFVQAKFLLNSGVDINALIDGKINNNGTALYHSVLWVRKRSIEVVDFLLKNGAKVNKAGDSRMSPLEAMSNTRSYKPIDGKNRAYFPKDTFPIIKLLIEYGADPTILNRWDKPDDKKLFSEHMCELLSDEDFLYFLPLLSKKQCQNILCFQRCLSFFQQDEEFRLKFKNYFDVEIFFKLAVKQDIPLPSSEMFDLFVDTDSLMIGDVKYLSRLVRNAEISQLQKLFDAYPKFADALVTTVLKNEVNKHILRDILQEAHSTAELCKNNLFQLIFCSGNDQNKLFRLLVLNKCFDHAKFLLELGTDIDALIDGKTTLHHALSRHDHDSIFMLPYFIDESPFSPRLEKIEFLLKNGADVNKQDIHKRTPLERLSEISIKIQIHGQKPRCYQLDTSSVIKLFLEKGSSPTIFDKWDKGYQRIKTSSEMISATATDDEFLYLFPFLTKEQCQKNSVFQRCFPLFQTNEVFKQKYQYYFDLGFFVKVATDPEIKLLSDDIFSGLIDAHNLSKIDIDDMKKALITASRLPSLLTLFYSYPPFVKGFKNALTFEDRKDIIKGLLRSEKSIKILFENDMLQSILVSGDITLENPENEVLALAELNMFLRSMETGMGFG